MELDGPRERAAMTEDLEQITDKYLTGKDLPCTITAKCVRAHIMQAGAYDLSRRRGLGMLIVKADGTKRVIGVVRRVIKRGRRLPALECLMYVDHEADGKVIQEATCIPYRLVHELPGE